MKVQTTKNCYRFVFYNNIDSFDLSLRKHPFLLALRRWERFARNVPGGEERGETDVFAGYFDFHFC